MLPDAPGCSRMLPEAPQASEKHYKFASAPPMGTSVVGGISATWLCAVTSEVYHRGSNLKRTLKV